MFHAAAACALFALRYERSATAQDASELLRTSTRAAASAGIPEAAAGAALDLALLGDYLALCDEMPSVNAVVGGVLANEVLKAVSASGTPLKNAFFFEAHDGSGMVEDLAADEPV